MFSKRVVGRGLYEKPDSRFVRQKTESKMKTIFSVLSTENKTNSLSYISTEESTVVLQNEASAVQGTAY